MAWINNRVIQSDMTNLSSLWDASLGPARYQDFNDYLDPLVIKNSAFAQSQLKNIAEAMMQRFDKSGEPIPGDASSDGASGGSNDPIMTPGGSYNPDPDDTVYDESFNLGEYLAGLLSSVGDEAAINREYNSAEALKNRQFQHHEADIQRRWYEEMSNSAYQRAVQDMQKAGINPILAFQQGGAQAATTGVPTGSAASHNAIGGDTISSILSGIADIVAAFSGSALNLSKLASLFGKKNPIGFR